jgi:GTP pyrophosphokinase
VVNLMFEPERRIAVEWGRDAATPNWQAGYPVKLAVYCDNRPGMLKQSATVISDANTNIRNIEAKTAEDQATVEIIADIADLKHLDRIVTGVRKIPGVRDVRRLQKL